MVLLVLILIFSSLQDYPLLLKLSSHDDNVINNKKVEEHTGDGWRAIYVYYGKDGVIEDHLEYKEKDKGAQVDQDKVILALYSKVYGSLDKVPYFVDLAANDALSLSNTYLLEQKGWDGLCIEPNHIYWYGLAHRKCRTVAACVGGTEDAEEMDVQLSNGLFGGIIGEDFDNKRKQRRGQKRFVVSLKTTFEKFNVPKVIDYMSLDIEGAEYLVMKHFPYEFYTFRFISIERPPPPLQKLLQSHEYYFVMMLVPWGDTLWVHKSVLSDISIDEIKDIVLNTSPWPTANTTHVWDLETGRNIQQYISEK